MHKCNYTSRIEELDGKLVMTVNAEWNGKTLDILRQDEDGRQEARNLVLAPILGYAVIFADETPYSSKWSNSYYGYSDRAWGLDEWGQSNVSRWASPGGYNKPSRKDLSAVAKKYPRFKKEVLSVFSPVSNRQLIEAVNLWKKESSFPRILATGAYNIAFGKAIYKSEKLQKKLYAMSKVDGMKYLSISDLTSCSDVENELVKRDSEFKYVLDKWDSSALSDKQRKAMARKLFSAWQKNKKIEFLVAKGFLDLALDSDTHRLDGIPPRIMADIIGRYASKSVKVDLFLRYYKFYDCYTEGEDVDKDRLECLLEFLGDKKWLTKKVFQYLLKRKDINLYQYVYYVRDCVFCSKTGDYWLCPKKFDLQCRKIAMEKKAINEFRENERKKALFANFEKKYGEFEKLDCNGYTVYMASSAEDVRVQAETLHQCLVACNYIDKCVQGAIGGLVFVKKGEIPVATAEIKSDGHLGQFYADELDRSNCLPSDGIRQAVESYLPVVLPKMKAMKLVA